jgi:hypothetical protein
MAAMDGPALSWHERKILEQIETTPASDARLARELSTMRRGRLRRPHRLLGAAAEVPAPVVTVLVALSTAMLLLGAQLRTAQALVPAGAFLTVTLFLLPARPLRRFVARRRGL